MRRALLIGENTAALAQHLRAAGMEVTEAGHERPLPRGPFALLVSLFPPTAADARAEIEGFAAQAPKAAREGADLRALAQVIVLTVPPAPDAPLDTALQAAAIEALVRQAALHYAPDLRVNAIALGPTRPAHPPHYAAWPAHQPTLGKAAQEPALFALFDYIRQADSITGQTLILNA